jgi:hypothetical protein
VAWASGNRWPLNGTEGELTYSVAAATESSYSPGNTAAAHALTVRRASARGRNPSPHRTSCGNATSRDGCMSSRARSPQLLALPAISEYGPQGAQLTVSLRWVNPYIAGEYAAGSAGRFCTTGVNVPGNSVGTREVRTAP